MSDPAAISIRDLHVSFKPEVSIADWVRRRPRQVLRAVDGVDLELRPAEAVGLVGESGSGKSTLARAIVGLQEHESGEIRLEGKPLTMRRSRRERRAVQMVFQDPYSSLNPRMSVGQVLRELLLFHDIVPRSGANQRARELLDLVGMPARSLNLRPRQFSGGQRQRIGIARALALDPRILIADEPVSALDVSVQASILNLLRDLQRDLGLTLLFVAHDLAVVRHICDRVAVMYLGRIIEVAPTAELFENPRHPYTQGLLRAIPRISAGRAKRGVAIKGDLPSPLNIPTGCRFRTRCAIAQDICHTQDPQLAADGDDPSHTTACHFPGKPAVPASPVSAAGT